MENGKKFDSSYFGQFGGESPRTTAQNTNRGHRVMTHAEYTAYQKQVKAQRAAAKAERSVQHGESARRNEANLRGAYQNQKKKISKGLVAALVVVGVAAAGIGGTALFNHFSGGSSDTAPVETPPPIVDTYTPESTPFDTGEALSDYDTLSNGVHYDYSHYLDYENKTTKKAYDYDMSSCFGDEERTIDGINEIADRTPEALASYAYGIFNKEEKQALGIDGMTMTQIDEYMSDENNQDGGAKQSAILAKLNEVLREDGTTFRFYYENGTEDSNYINWVDANQDGIMTPDEAVLGYSRRQRNHAPQVDIYRDGKKVLDLNMLCGFQPNYEINETPGDLPEFPDDPEDKHDDDGGGTPEEHHDDEDGGTPKTGGGTPETGGGTPHNGGGDPEDETGKPKEEDKIPDDDPDGEPEQPGPGPGGTPEQPVTPPVTPPKNVEAEIEHAGPRAQIVTTPGEQTEDPSEDMARAQEEARAAEGAEAERQRAIEQAEAEQKAKEQAAAAEAAARREAAEKKAAEEKAAADKKAAEEQAAKEAERKAEEARAAEAEQKAKEQAAAEQAAREAAKKAAEQAAEEEQEAEARQDASTTQAAENEQTAPTGGESAGERAGLSY